LYLLIVVCCRLRCASVCGKFMIGNCDWRRT